MSDGAKNPIGGTFETVGQAVVKPVVDEVGKAIEQGVQSVIGVPKAQQPNQNSLQPSAQPTPVDNAKLQETRRKIEWWKNLDSEQRKVRETKKQQQAQALQAEGKKKEDIAQFKIVKKKESIALSQAKTKTEIRGGVGG